VLLALGRVSYSERAQIDKSLELLLIGQSGSGGWGPYPKAPPEAFDTAGHATPMRVLHGDDTLEHRNGGQPKY